MWVNLLDSVKSESSTNSKLELLTSYFQSNDSTLIEIMFDLLLNYEVNSYLSDINKLEKSLENTLKSYIGSSSQSEEFFVNEIYKPLKFSKKRFKKIEWIQILKELAGKCQSSNELDYYLQFITKSLTIGLSIQGYNKVAEKMSKVKIPKFDCMRCSSMGDSQIDFNNCFVSVKKDGVNATFHNGTFFTRNGGAVLLPKQQLELDNIFKDFVVFGELVSTSRQSSSGLVTSALKLGVCSTLPVDTLKLHIFDILPKEDFEQKNFENFPFYKRVEMLSQFKSGENYEIIEHHKSTSIDDVYSWNEHYYSQGEEGIIANDYNAIFEFSRSKFRSKIKAEYDGEFKIVSYNPHSKKENWIGSLIIESSDGKIRCSVGSGFSEEDRLEVMSNIENYIGKICTVKYNAVDKKTNSLFLPVFKEMRCDKDEANTYEELNK